MLGSRVLGVLEGCPNLGDRFKAIYVFLLSHTPFPVIHKGIVAPIFLILNIVYLCQKSVAEEFT
jgi:hypothetical protein